MFRTWRILLDPQGGEGNGTENPKAEAGGDKVPDLVKAVEGLVSRHGDGTAALRVVLGENHEYRNQIRELKAKLPPEGSRVLHGDDLKRWETYRELGDPSDLRKALGERDTYKTEADRFRRAEQIAEVAGLPELNWDAAVLRDLADQKSLDLQIAEEKGKDGKAVRVAIVKGEGDSATPLVEYAEKHWAKYLPILKKEPEKARPLGTPHIARTPAPPGVGVTAAPAPPPRRNQL